VASLHDNGLKGFNNLSTLMSLAATAERKTFHRDEYVLQFPSYDSMDGTTHKSHYFTSYRLGMEYIYIILSGECCSVNVSDGKDTVTSHSDEDDMLVYHDKGSLIGKIHI
jgi:CRP-like cAMP-binding protein